jgi:hypothetical protein
MAELGNTEAEQGGKTTEPPRIFLNTQHRLQAERRAAARSQRQKLSTPLPPLSEGPIIPNTAHREQAELVTTLPIKSTRIIRAS